ncbi:MAG: hypothetical protein Q7R41_06680 [Phycisphaerales bacterium]|nr:hypothetical protein [Phycisphaerales bacterium]
MVLMRQTPTSDTQRIRTTLPPLSRRDLRRLDYDVSTDIVIRDGSGFKGDLERTLPYIANAHVQRDECRVRFDGSARTNATFSLPIINPNRHEVVNILKPDASLD